MSCNYIRVTSTAKPNSILLKKIAFIVRGNLKNPNEFRYNISKYFHKEFEVFLKFTRERGHAIEIVDELLESYQVDYLVGVGGDGTFSEVVNGYMMAPKSIREKVVLATFPRGRGNDFSRTAGMVRNMEHLYECIKSNETRPLDLVKVSFKEDGIKRVKYFDNSFDVGLGGLVSRYVNKSGKRWGSNLTYFVNIIKGFLTYKPIPLRLTSENFNFEGEALILALNNGKYFGSGLCIAPDAKLDDGKVNLFLAKKIHVFEFLKFYPSLKKGKYINHKELVYGELSECRIESPISDCPIELDGEVVGQAPLKIKVIEHAARIIKVL